MKKIAIAGYHYSGCGVIDDLFREFDNVAQPTSENESRYLQDADGVSDLEYHLVDNPHRINTELAIDRFLRYCKNRESGYKQIYGSEWYQICHDYVESLLKFKFKGYDGNVLSERGPQYNRTILIWRIKRKLTPPKFRTPFDRQNFFPHEYRHHAHPSEEEFLMKTQAFTETLCEHMITNKKAEYVMLDQMLAGNNPERYMRYVTNCKAFIVDRDPRDLYINQRRMNGHKLPTDPHLFCEHFRDIRTRFGEPANPEHVMYLMIEDMIYNYDEMVNRVCDFVGIDQSHHIEKKKYFNPSISINGTRTWERYPEYADAVKIIENELQDYLYDYSKIKIL